MAQLAKRFLMFFLCVFLLQRAAIALAELPDRIEISAGESRVLKTGFVVEKIAIGDPDVCGAVKTAEQEVLINAKKPGQSNIFIWAADNGKAEIQVIVKSSEINNMANELKEVIRDIEGVDVRVIGSRIFVEGEVFTQNAMRRIEKVIAGMPDVVNLVEFSPVMKDIVKSEIEKSWPPRI